MEISVALATYNGATNLAEQLDSLAAQTLLPAELVVGDDGSTDDTLAILDAFAKIAPFPVRVHRNPSRLGYRANFFAAAQRCRGQLISFCDQDDYWLPENLARVAAAFDDPDVLLTFHNALIVDAGRRPLGPFFVEPPMPPLARRLELSPWMFSPGFTQTFRASLVPATDLWSLLADRPDEGEQKAHDRIFFLLAAGLGSIRYLSDELTEYRQHGANLYGSGKRFKPNLLQRWRYRLEYRADMYRVLATASPRNAALFRWFATQPEISAELCGRAAQAAIAWDELGPLYRDRAIACAAPFPARLAAFMRLARRGGYGDSNFWTFGRKAMVKDFVLGVVFARLVQKFGFETAKTDRACHRGRRQTADGDSEKIYAAPSI